LFFGPEQGIDFMAIKGIVAEHHITLIGPKTDIDGIFHGPFYYYLSVIPFLLSKGNPLVASIFLIILNACTVFIAYLLGKELRSKRLGLILAVLVTVSFGSIVYARWLSGQPLLLPLTFLFLLFATLFLKGKQKALLGMAVTFGLLGQIEFLNFFFLLFILLTIIIIFRKEFRATNKLILLFSVLLLLVSSATSYVLFDLRHSFLITHSIINLLHGEKGYYVPFIQSAVAVFAHIFSAYTLFIFPYSEYISIVLFAISLAVVIIAVRNKQKLLVIPLLLIFIPMILLILLRHESLTQFFAICAPGFMIVTAYTMDRYFRVVGIILLTVIVMTNLMAVFRFLPTNQNVFFQSTQPELRYSNELQVIDTIYTKAQGKQFSYHPFTIPYWQAQAWDYLFWYYGKNKYGYLPGENKPRHIFAIIQHDPNSKQIIEDWLRKDINSFGPTKSDTNFGILTVREVVVTK
jgi:4-amino-4-deoxy-L-arabinose transferase-like glycosyltransferase